MKTRQPPKPVRDIRDIIDGELDKFNRFVDRWLIRPIIITTLAKYSYEREWLGILLALMVAYCWFDRNSQKTPPAPPHSLN